MRLTLLAHVKWQKCFARELESRGQIQSCKELQTDSCTQKEIAASEMRVGFYGCRMLFDNQQLVRSILTPFTPNPFVKEGNCD